MDQYSVEKPTKSPDLIPGSLRLELDIAFRAFDAVISIVVLRECQRSTLKRRRRTKEYVLHRTLRWEFTAALQTAMAGTPLRLRAIVSWTAIVCIFRTAVLIVICVRLLGAMRWRRAYLNRFMRRSRSSATGTTHEKVF